MLNSGDEVNNCVLRNLKICMAGMSDKDTQIFCMKTVFLLLMVDSFSPIAELEK
jgi:hypothetical protein